MITHILKEHISKEKFPDVIRALRQNKIIWEELNKNNLLEKLLRQATENTYKWTPANIALTALGFGGEASDLKNLDMDLGRELKQKAGETLKALMSSSIPEEDFSVEQAGLAALAIRERWMMLDHIEEDFFNFIPQYSSFWETTISILYGLISNQKLFIYHLIYSPRETENTYAVHALLSQPYSITQIAQKLVPNLLIQEVMRRSGNVRLINQKSPTLARIIAEQLLEQLSENELQSEDSFQQLVHFIERTELLKLSGQYNQVIPELEQIWNTTTRMQADMTAQLAQAAARNNDQDTAIKAINKVSELEKFIQSEGLETLTLAQINAGKLNLSQSNQDVLPKNIGPLANPANLLANAKIALQNSNYQEAQHFAHQVYSLTYKFLDQQDPKVAKPSNLFTPEFLLTFLETLIAVNLPMEAATIGKLAQQILPNDPDIVWMYAQASAKIGDYDEAVEYTDIAFALSPTNLTIHRFLIDLLIKQSSWMEARKEAEDLINSADLPLPEDYNALAQCYLNTGQEQDAIKICHKGLSKHPNHWKIHQLLGTIYQKKGKNSAAKKHFRNAIVENPQQVIPWLQLAKLYADNQEAEKALEKLQSAAEVIPNHPEIYLNIGLLQLAAKKEIKAIAAFNQAARFIQPETPNLIKRQIGMNLGKTLLDSGYVTEASTALAKTHRENPTDVQVAYLYSQALIRSRKYEEAFKALTITIQAGNPPNSARLDYAFLILELSKNPEQAIEFIQNVLKVEPENEKAIILLARATAAADDHQQAISLYQDAFQTELAKEPEYFTLLATGIADSAFRTDQPEVAITFLQEALRQMPDNLKLKQKLCQGFFQANLIPDALALLENIRTTSDASIENLLWISDQAIAMNELDLAIEILEEANQASPQMADVIVRLGYVQLENNQEAKARETFSQLFAAENVDAADMKMAAHALIGLGDISSSIPFIEKALDLCDYQSGDLLSELTKLHLKAGNSLAALDTIQKHLQVDAENAEIWATKSEILHEIGRPNAAMEALMEAIKLSPKSASLHSLAAERFIERQDLALSLDHIQKAFAIDPKNNRIRLLTAYIKHICLESMEALELLENAQDPPKSLDWMLLEAELSLEDDAKTDPQEIAKIVAEIQELEPNHPAGLSLLSRVQARSSKPYMAAQTLEKAIFQFSSMPESDDYVNSYQTLLALSKTALEQKLWDISLFLAREALKYVPSAPSGYLLLAKIFTRRAEFQLKCQATQTIAHAPGKIALNDWAKEAFKNAIEKVHANLPVDVGSKMVQRWENRGMYALFGQSPGEDYSATSAEDLAAVIAVQRRAGDKLSFNAASDRWLDSDEVKFQLSLYYAKGQIEHAESIAEETLLQESPDPIYLANYAFLAKRAGYQEEAFARISEALSIWPDEPRWHAFAAALEKENGNISEAISHFEQASALEKNNSDHLYRLGSIYLLNNLPGNAVRVLQEAVSINPLEVAYWVALSKGFEGLSDYDRAIESIEKAISLSPKQIGSLLIAADIAYSKGNIKKGNKYIQECLNLSPKNIEDIIYLTNILVKQGRSDEALDILDQIVEYSLSPVLLFIQKAEILGETEGINEKLKLLVSLVREHPKDPIVLSRLAGTYLEAKMPEEAIRAAQYAIKNAGEDLSVQEKAKIHYQLGILYQKTGQLDQSLHNLTQVIKLSPHFLEAYLEIGETLRQRREHTQAIGFFEKAIEIAPKDPRGYAAAGLLLKDGKDYAGAEAYLRTASSLAPKDIFIQRQLATVIALAIIHPTEKV